MGWIIYISGFIATYLMCKLIRNRNNNKNSWKDVLMTLFLSIYSWISFTLICALALFLYLKEKITLKNPPKWL